MSRQFDPPTPAPDGLTLMSASARPLDVSRLGTPRPIPTLLWSAVGCVLLSGVFVASAADEESLIPVQLAFAAGSLAIGGACLLAAVVIAARRHRTADLQELLRRSSAARES